MHTAQFGGLTEKWEKQEAAAAAGGGDGGRPDLLSGGLDAQEGFVGGFTGQQAASYYGSVSSVNSDFGPGPTRHHRLFMAARRFSYPLSAALCATLFTMVAKGAVKMISTSLAGDNQFGHALPWFLLGAMIAFGAGQAHLINRSLQRCDALYHVPSFYVIWNSASQVFSATLFHDFRDFTSRNYAGVYCLPSTVCPQLFALN
jgi:hypothetical protein